MYGGSIEAEKNKGEEPYGKFRKKITAEN